jgi:hypothetical protein
MKSKLKKYGFVLLPRMILRPAVVVIDQHYREIFRSQDDEWILIEQLINRFNVEKKELFFFEFGFGPTEFNCAKLSKKGVSGILVDSDVDNVKIGRKILHSSTLIQHRTLRPSDLIELPLRENNFNILSIDVDGNDFEFAQYALSHNKPELLIIEYNSSFGDKRVKVPTEENFDRRKYHGNFHGASLLSLCDLMHQFDYCLVAVSKGAVNAFFVPSSYQSAGCDSVIQYSLTLNSSGKKSENSGQTWEQQFAALSVLPLEFMDSEKTPCPKSNTQHKRVH